MVTDRSALTFFMSTSLLILLPLIALLVSPLLIVILRIWKPRFSYYWLASTFSALLAWLSIALLRSYLPLITSIGLWQPVEIFPVSPQFNIDISIWLFAIACVTVLLASNLLGIAGLSERKETTHNWMSLAGGSGITGLSLLVMFSANILTVLLTWMLLDIAEFLVYLSHAKTRADNERAVINLSVRITGLFIGIFAGMSAFVEGMPLALGELSIATSSILILAVCVRIALVPNALILPDNIIPQKVYGIFLRLITTAAHFPLLYKTAQTGADNQLQEFLWIWAGLTALISAVSWYSSNSTQFGVHHWNIVLSSLVVASAMSRNAQAVVAFGWTLLLPGSLILLSDYRNKALTGLYVLGILAISALPFTPTWSSVILYSNSFHISWLLFIPAQILIIGGFIQQILRKDSLDPRLERWERWTHLGGLILILVITFLLSWWAFRGSLGSDWQSPDLLSSWPAIIVLVGIGILWLLARRISKPARFVFSGLQRILSFERLFKPVWSLYFFLRRILLFISRNLESQAGILWALLLLVLIISLYGQISPENPQ